MPVNGCVTSDIYCTYNYFFEKMGQAQKEDIVYVEKVVLITIFILFLFYFLL